MKFFDWPDVSLYGGEKKKWKWQYVRHYSVATFTGVISLSQPILYLEFLDNPHIL
jgi:hypothetical protein